MQCKQYHNSRVKCGSSEEKRLLEEESEREGKSEQVGRK
jgi:hypothetical protein